MHRHIWQDNKEVFHVDKLVSFVSGLRILAITARLVEDDRKDLKGPDAPFKSNSKNE